MEDVIQGFQGGGRVLIHCNGGLGRAGTMAACVRMALKLDDDPEAAIASVRKLRGERATETREQEDFVARFRTQWQTCDSGTLKISRVDFLSMRRDMWSTWSAPFIGSHIQIQRAIES